MEKERKKPEASPRPVSTDAERLKYWRKDQGIVI